MFVVILFTDVFLSVLSLAIKTHTGLIVFNKLLAVFKYRDSFGRTDAYLRDAAYICMVQGHFWYDLG